MKNIINIINFARNCEPRKEDNTFLFETFAKEMELCKQYNFRSTVLLQYDALIDSRYTELVKAHNGLCECGLWLELTQPQAEDADITWHGRYPWDWANNVNFFLGYGLADREKLIDTAFNKFYGIFGYYPEVVGCWAIDAYSMNYIEEHYKTTAACICKEQFGTDGISLWGGYYNGAYYPSKNNFLCPAHTPENSLKTPVFRMLGPDPIKQYDMGIGEPDKGQGVTTLEPVYPLGGGRREWVEWYFNENFNGKGLALSYAQTGQENSFGWDNISQGLPMQFEILSERIKNGEIELMTLGEAGKWFSDNFSITPPCAMCTDTDIWGSGYKSLWYSCKNYRINVLYKNGMAWIRDMQLFDDNYKEKYLDKAEDKPSCAFFNLPVTDGFRFSKDGIRAGIYVYRDKEKYSCNSDFETFTVEPDTAGARLTGKMEFILTENEINITFNEDELYLVFEFSNDCDIPYVKTAEKELSMSFKGKSDSYYDYSVRLAKGCFAEKDGRIVIMPENGQISILPFNALH